MYNRGAINKQLGSPNRKRKSKENAVSMKKVIRIWIGFAWLALRSLWQAYQSLFYGGERSFSLPEEIQGQPKKSNRQR